MVYNEPMQRVYEFISKAECYFLLTTNDGKPYGRPFASFMEYEGCLFFATSTTKMVYHQLKENNNIQIIAKKKNAYDWIRISGQAEECHDEWVKDEMMEVSPRAAMLFSSSQDPTLALFRISSPYVEYN